MHSEQTIEVAHCAHCGTHVLNPKTDGCPNVDCEADELYPVSRIVPPGSYVKAGKLHEPSGEVVMQLGRMT